MSAALWFIVRPADALFEPIGVDRDRDLLRKLRKTEPITDWIERRYKPREGEPVDFPFELDGMRLCSDRLREAIDAAKGPKDALEWLPAVLEHAGEEYRYWGYSPS